MAEGVGDDAQGHEPGVRPCVRPGLDPAPLQGAQGADGRGTLAGLAVGQEVVLAEQGAGTGVHGLDVEQLGQPQDGGAPGGVARGGGVGDPVGVAAAQGAEAGVEGLRHGARPGDDDIAGPARRARQALLGLTGQDARHPGEQGGLGEALGASGQCGPGLGAHVEVGHLGGGVDAGVGASGHGEADGLTQHGGQGGGEDPLDGAQPGLGGPPGEEGAVVGQVEADAWHGPIEPHWFRMMQQAIAGRAGQVLEGSRLSPRVRWELREERAARTVAGGTCPARLFAPFPQRTMRFH